MVEVAVANDMAMMLESIVERLVDTPEDIFVDMKISETGVSLRLTVREEEVGQVIGRQGRTARALRWIVGIAAARAKVPYQLEIVEAKGREAAAGLSAAVEMTDDLAERAVQA